MKRHARPGLEVEIRVEADELWGYVGDKSNQQWLWYAIERTNLTLRTHIKRLHRKTICFSKNETIHANVIGMYLEHYYYNNPIYEEIA